MRNKLLLLAVLAGALCANATTLSILPTTQTINLGSSGTADVQVSGLPGNDVIGAFDLTVNHNSTILDATSITFSSALGVPANQLTGTSLLSGSANAAETSFESTATLQGLQPTQPFTLFAITYQGLVAGTSSLDFLNSALTLSDGAGNIIKIDSLQSGSITVVNGSGTPGVPEPASAGLLGLSGCLAVAFGVARRLRSNLA